MNFRIVVAPARNSARNRSPILHEFIEALKRLKSGQALQVTAEQLGWAPNTTALTTRIHHACTPKGIKVCTETQSDGSIKVWLQKKESSK